MSTCAPSGSSCAADGQLCYGAPLTCACQGAGVFGIDPSYTSLTGSCAPTSASSMCFLTLPTSEQQSGGKIPCWSVAGLLCYATGTPCLTDHFESWGGRDGHISPSSPPSSAWPGCTEQDFIGDFDKSGLATLGDAAYIARARMSYGLTLVNPIKCIDGDFDQDGVFTVNDAALVASAQFGSGFLPWHLDPESRG